MVLGCLRNLAFPLGQPRLSPIKGVCKRVWAISEMVQNFSGDTYVDVQIPRMSGDEDAEYPDPTLDVGRLFVDERRSRTSALVEVASLT